MLMLMLVLVLVIRYRVRSERREAQDLRVRSREVTTSCGHALGEVISYKLSYIRQCRSLVASQKR